MASNRQHLSNTIRDDLKDVVEPACVDQWLSTPNPAFAGLSPLELIERGESDRLWRMIYELESGQPG